MTTKPCKHRRALFGALTYLVVLAVLLAGGWFYIFTDTATFTVKRTELLDARGENTMIFRAGDEVRLERLYCVKDKLILSASPALVSDNGTIFPLPSLNFMTEGGCHLKLYGFIMPDLPAGNYRIRSTVSFRDGIINGDTVVVLPPVNLRIIQ